MENILLKNNLPHVVTAFGNGKFEELDANGTINPKHVILGMSELNKNGISLLNISVGTSKEGITKIDQSVIECGSVYTKDESWSRPPYVSIELPEGENIVPFKSDSWVLGEFLVRNVYHPEGKSVPKKFMKSQTLLDKFIDSLGSSSDAEILKKLLVLDPHKREFTWNIYEDQKGCTIQ